MKLGILSDIHGNRVALAAVLAVARAQGISRLLCCGDFIGYGHRPAETLALLDDWVIDSCQGNHDVMIAETAHARYGTGVAIAAAQLTPERRAKLAALPHPHDLSIAGRAIRLCHGTPWDRDEYLYPDADPARFERAAQGGFHLVAMGHTHYPLIRRLGNTWLVNPGSVGQQRNGVPGAHWVAWDTVADTLTAMVTAYDPTEIIADSRRIDPDLPYLADIHLRQGPSS